MLALTSIVAGRRDKVNRAEGLFRVDRIVTSAPSPARHDFHLESCRAYRWQYRLTFRKFISPPAAADRLKNTLPGASVSAPVICPGNLHDLRPSRGQRRHLLLRGRAESQESRITMRRKATTGSLRGPQGLRRPSPENIPPVWLVPGFRDPLLRLIANNTRVQSILVQANLVISL